MNAVPSFTRTTLFVVSAQSWEDDSNQTEHWTQQYQIKHRPDQMILYRPLYWGRWCYHHHLRTSRLIKLRLTLWVRLLAFHFVRIVLVSSCKSAEQNIYKACWKKPSRAGPGSGSWIRGKTASQNQGQNNPRKSFLQFYQYPSWYSCLLIIAMFVRGMKCCWALNLFQFERISHNALFRNSQAFSKH